MIDGQLGQREWDDATRVPLGEFARLYAKQCDGYVYLAVEWHRSDMFTMDLYLAADGKLFDLHSSAKLGERQLHDGSWSEEWQWWNNSGWVANWSRVDQWKSPVTFMPQKVREFQIARERFPGTAWKIMFEFMAPGQTSWQSYTFPQNAKTTSTSGENWILLQLSGNDTRQLPRTGSSH